LFVASRIADLQNIQLSVESCAPSGAAFTVGLPLAHTGADGEHPTAGAGGIPSVPQ
jgi:hypothetical protein